MAKKSRATDRAAAAGTRSGGRPSAGRREHRERFWAAIARGASSVDAATEAGVLPSVGVRWFRKGGGMPFLTLAPVSGRYLSFTEREEIAVLLARGSGVREIARQLGRAPSTISRELQRNAAIRTGRPEYRASTAQTHADRRARRPKPAKLAVNPELRRYVQDRLAGSVQRPDGSVAGPQVGWGGRRHGPRKDRRWGKSSIVAIVASPWFAVWLLSASHDGRGHVLADTPCRPSLAASSAGLPLGGMWVMARSASAVIVRAGLTPTLAGMAAPSQTSRFW